MRGRSYTAKVVDRDVGRPSGKGLNGGTVAASASAFATARAPSTFTCPLALPARLIYSSLCRCLPFFWDFFFISVLLPVFCFRKRQPLIYTPSLHRAGPSEGAFAFTRYCRSLPLLCCPRRYFAFLPFLSLYFDLSFSSPPDPYILALAKHQRRGTLLTNTVRCARCESQFRNCTTCQRGIAFKQVYITCGMWLLLVIANQTRHHHANSSAEKFMTVRFFFFFHSSGLLAKQKWFPTDLPTPRWSPFNSS